MDREAWWATNQGSSLCPLKWKRRIPTYCPPREVPVVALSVWVLSLWEPHLFCSVLCPAPTK